jgi:hypothetical protein
LVSAKVTGRWSIDTSRPLMSRVTRSGNAASIAGVRSGKPLATFSELFLK